MEPLSGHLPPQQAASDKSQALSRSRLPVHGKLPPQSRGGGGVAGARGGCCCSALPEPPQIPSTSCGMQWPQASTKRKKTPGCTARPRQAEDRWLMTGHAQQPRRGPSCAPISCARLSSATGACRPRSSSSSTMSVSAQPREVLFTRHAPGRAFEPGMLPVYWGHRNIKPSFPFDVVGTEAEGSRTA